MPGSQSFPAVAEITHPETMAGSRLRRLCGAGSRPLTWLKLTTNRGMSRRQWPDSVERQAVPMSRFRRISTQTGRAAGLDGAGIDGFDRRRDGPSGDGAGRHLAATRRAAPTTTTAPTGPRPPCRPAPHCSAHRRHHRPVVDVERQHRRRLDLQRRGAGLHLRRHPTIGQLNFNGAGILINGGSATINANGSRKP